MVRQIAPAEHGPQPAHVTVERFIPQAEVLPHCDLVVSHGGSIRVAAAHITGADRLHLGSPPNASMTVFELGARPRLLVYGSLPDGGLPTGLY